MKAWWENLSPRERLSLQGLGLFLGAVVLIQFIIVPLIDWRSDASRRVRTAETAYRLVSEAAAIGAGGSAAADSATPARNALRELALAHGVTLNFINERPDGSVEAQAASVEPEALFEMFFALEQRYGVRVVAVDIARLGEAAPEVRAQMTVAR